MSRRPKRANLYSGEIDNSWQKYRPCDACGQQVCYNNWPDRLGRQKRYTFRGFFLCTRCDPRGFTGFRPDDKKIRNRRIYKGILARQLIRKMADMPCLFFDPGGNEDGTIGECGKCPICLARRIEGIKVE